MGLTDLLTRLRRALFDAFTFRAGLFRADLPPTSSERPRQ